MKLKATLRLENGMEFHGWSFGSAEAVSGEVVFNTSMVGYPEQLTDPTYSGQILCLTYPLIGNYGVPSEELMAENLSLKLESDRIHPKGLIVFDVCEDYSNWEAEKGLEQWMKEQNLTGIYGIDTRELTKILRDKGSMTGEIIPDALVEKIEAAGNFNQGFMTTELAAASLLDLKWHMLSSVEDLDPMAFEAAACKEMGLIDEIIPRYRSTYFAHIFSGGYSAGYYSYLWAEVLDKDAFELFMQKGIFDKETAMSFRHNVLEKGGSDEPMDLYRRFRGADPDSGALLRGRGL